MCADLWLRARNRKGKKKRRGGEGVMALAMVASVEESTFSVKAELQSMPVAILPCPVAGDMTEDLLPSSQEVYSRKDKSLGLLSRK